MKLIVCGINKDIFELNIKQNAHISDVKYNIANVKDILVENQTLIFMGNILHDDTTCEYNGIKDNSKIILIRSNYYTIKDPISKYGFHTMKNIEINNINIDNNNLNIPIVEQIKINTGNNRNNRINLNNLPIIPDDIINPNRMSNVYSLSDVYSMLSNLIGNRNINQPGIRSNNSILALPDGNNINNNNNIYDPNLTNGYINNDNNDDDFSYSEGDDDENDDINNNHIRYSSGNYIGDSEDDDDDDIDITMPSLLPSITGSLSNNQNGNAQGGRNTGSGISLVERIAERRRNLEGIISNLEGILGYSNNSDSRISSTYNLTEEQLKEVNSIYELELGSSKREIAEFYICCNFDKEATINLLLNNMAQ